MARTFEALAVIRERAGAAAGLWERPFPSSGRRVPAVGLGGLLAAGT